MDGDIGAEAARFQAEYDHTAARAMNAGSDAARLRLWVRFWGRWHVCRHSRLHRSIALMPCIRPQDRYEPRIYLISDSPVTGKAAPSFLLEQIVMGFVCPADGDPAEYEWRADIVRSATEHAIAKGSLAMQHMGRASGEVE